MTSAQESRAVPTLKWPLVGCQVVIVEKSNQNKLKLNGRLDFQAQKVNTLVPYHNSYEFHLRSPDLTWQERNK